MSMYCIFAIFCTSLPFFVEKGKKNRFPSIIPLEFRTFVALFFVKDHSRMN